MGRGTSFDDEEFIIALLGSAPKGKTISELSKIIGSSGQQGYWSGRMDELVKKKLISTGFGESEKKRPATLYSINEENLGALWDEYFIKTPKEASVVLGFFASPPIMQEGWGKIDFKKFKKPISSKFNLAFISRWNAEPGNFDSIIAYLSTARNQSNKPQLLWLSLFSILIASSFFTLYRIKNKQAQQTFAAFSNPNLEKIYSSLKKEMPKESKDFELDVYDALGMKIIKKTE